jgi:methionyl-tRNA formyltransferase
LKILFAGTTAHAAQVLKHLVSSKHEVVSVLTRKDAPVGRKSVITPSPVAAVATDLGLPVIKANQLGSEENQLIADASPDLAIVIAYGALLPVSTLSIPNHGWLNLHYSLLPQWRGAAPVQHSILNGDKVTGVTIFRLDEGMDTGPILSQVPTEIQAGETSGDLLQRLTHIGISALDECLALVESNLAVFKPQVGPTSIARKLSRSDAKVDWSANSVAVENLILAMNPEPMAWTLLANQPFRILSARASKVHGPELTAMEVGSVFNFNNRIMVSCGNETALELVKVQPSGKKEMTAGDWFRGLSGSVVFYG